MDERREWTERKNKKGNTNIKRFILSSYRRYTRL